ncbi:MAG: hypothetical protein IKN82_08355 [Treponema sp.]|nr:hypothetical protein [Treponema sp.]
MTSTILFVCAGILFVIGIIFGIIFEENGYLSWHGSNDVIGTLFCILSLILLVGGLNSYQEKKQSEYIYFVRLDDGQEYTLDPKKNELKFNGDWISFVDDYGKHISAKGFTATSRLKDEMAIPCIRADDLSRIPTEILKEWKTLLRNEITESMLRNKFTESKSDNYGIWESYMKVNDELSERELEERLAAVKKEAEK